MKKISRKLLVSSLSLAFATVALGTTTFAWFTSNAQVTANITVGVQSTGDSILISTDCFNWGSSVEIDQHTLAMSPVTYNATAATLAASDKLVKLDGTDASATNYLQFTVYLKVSNKDKRVMFKAVDNEAKSDTDSRKTYSILKETTFTYGDAGEMTSGASATLATGKKIKADAVNALRSVVDVSQEGTAASEEYINDATATTAAQIAFKTTENTSGTITYTRKNKVAQFLGDGTQPTNITNGDTINFGQTLAGNNAANAYIEKVLGTNFSNPDGADYKAANTNYVGINPVNGWSSQTTVATDGLFDTVNTEAVYALRFTYWLEGYDADCFDVIMAQALALNLSFTAVNKPE